MEPYVFRKKTPRGELVLRIEHGRETRAALLLDGMILMDSDLTASEIALARRGIETVAGSRTLRVLLAGLGLGITLRELLLSPRVERVDVVEIFPQVVSWNRGPLSGMNGRALSDRRVRVLIADLRDVLAGAWRDTPNADRHDPARYDLLLFDIDNGPTWLSLPGNEWLYSKEGLEAVARRMERNGAAVFWASERAEWFETRLSEMTDLAWHHEALPAEAPDGDRALTYDLYFVRHRA